MGVGAVEVAFGPGVEVVRVYRQLFLGRRVVRVEGELRHQLYYYYRLKLYITGFICGFIKFRVLF